MISEVRYQVFVSSTYEDLRQERQQATQAILESGFFPSGMELFPASDDSQWELIKRVIEESDYYIVIVAGRYGSIGPAGKSFTEMEYDYAVEVGLPVLGFVRNNIDDIAAKYAEQSAKGRSNLDAFRNKVKSRTCRLFSSPAELGMAVMKSLISEARVRPRIGWIRADKARSEEDILRERQLLQELQNANERIASLEREIRDGIILADEIPRESLVQGDDVFDVTVTFQDNEKRHVTELIQLSWDELFLIIGPTIYGYIHAKRDNWREKGYLFQDNIEEHIRAKIIDRVQGRKIKIEPSQIDACILQFKELGLLRFAEQSSENGEFFRGVTLTEAGERYLTLLTVKRRSPLE